MNKWPTVCLGECCAVVSGGTPKTGIAEYWGDEICWATPADLGKLDGKLIGDTPRKLSADGLRSCSATILPVGSVLLSSRAPIGHVAINTVPMATNQGFKSLVPRPGLVNSDYLYHWLRFHRSYLENLGVGATFKEISKAAVSRVEITLPPIEEQKRIAKTLDQADVLLVKRRRSILLLDSLMKSIFYDLFDKEKNFQVECRLGDVADIVSGITKGRKVPTGVPLRTVPYLAVANVQDMRLSLSNVKTIDASAAEIERYRLRKNDLLLTEGGDPDKLGRGTLWGEEMSEVIHQNHIFRVRLFDRNVNPVFLNWNIGSGFGKAYFLRSAKQTTGIASINSTQLKNFPLHLPPIREQEEFAEKMSNIYDARVLHIAHLRALEEISSSLKAKAFRGEL